MNKPIKPNITIPQSFAENGIKTDFDSDLLTDGFDNLRPDVLAGDNLNKFIDDTYKGLNYGIAAADAINLIQEGETLTVQNGQLVSGSAGGGLEVCDIGMALYVDETKGLRRYLNGQIVDINTNTQAFLNRLKEIQTTNPDYFTTEDNWQAEATLNIDGCVYKFVLNYAGDTVVSVRLPKYPDYVEIDSNSINSTAPVSVYGNGKILGLTDGTHNIGLIEASSNGCYMTVNAGSVTNVGQSVTSGGTFAKTYTGIGVRTSASTSGLAGTATITSSLKQTKLKMRYFIQIATGSETENNIINDIELNNPFSLLDYKYSEYELNNLSWLRSNGQYNAKAIYPTVYDLLLKIYNGTETKAGVSVKLSTESYTDTDFVLNTAEETFRLPIKVKQKILNAIDGNMPVVGNGKALGVTDGTGDYGVKTNSGNFASVLSQCASALNKDVGTSDTSAGHTNADKVFGVSTNASNSGLIAKVSQSEVSGLYLYFYVGETVQNANLINAGRIEEKVAGLIPDNSNLISSYGMPSSKYINLTLGASNSTYTAPANGYFACLLSIGSGTFNIYVQNNLLGTQFTTTIEIVVKAFVPVQKGQVMQLVYPTPTTQTYKTLRFIYAEGAKND